MTELAIGSALLACLVWWRVILEWRAYHRRLEALEVARITVKIVVDVSAYTAALQALIPVMAKSIVVANDLALAMSRVREVVEEP